MRVYYWKISGSPFTELNRRGRGEGAGTGTGEGAGAGDGEGARSGGGAGGGPSAKIGLGFVVGAPEWKKPPQFVAPSEKRVDYLVDRPYSPERLKLKIDRTLFVCPADLLAFDSNIRRSSSIIPRPVTMGRLEVGPAVRHPQYRGR